MKQSIINELIAHAQDLIESGHINQDNIDDAHHIAFNEDYYIIGFYQADEWLKKHGVSPWDAIGYVIEQQEEMLGEVILLPDDCNSEHVVNQLVFFAGCQVDFEDLLSEVEEA